MFSCEKFNETRHEKRGKKIIFWSGKCGSKLLATGTDYWVTNTEIQNKFSKRLTSMKTLISKRDIQSTKMTKFEV